MARKNSIQTNSDTINDGTTPQDTRADLVARGGLSNEDYVARLTAGIKYLGKQVRLDRGACSRFRDPAATGQYESSSSGNMTNNDSLDGGDVLEAIPVGQTNTLTVNMYTLLAAVTINDPDFLPELIDEVENPPPPPQLPPAQPGMPPPPQPPAPPDPAEIKRDVRNLFRKLWKDGDWSAELRMAFLKATLSGVGACWFRWDSKAHKPEFCHVNSWDLCVDPAFVKFNKMRYCAVRITMSMREARQTYPEAFQNEPLEAVESQDEKPSFWIYWDNKNEVVITDKGHKVVRISPNEYGRLPIEFVLGEPDPGTSKFPLGLGVLAAGVAQEVSDFDAAISNSAKHGGPINFFGPGVPKATKDALQNGKQQDFYELNDMSSETFPIKRIPGESLERTVLEARQNSARSIDDITGVTMAMRGQLVANITATQSHDAENKSGARQVQNRAKYENFIDRCADACLKMLQMFGGPEADDDGQIVTDPGETDTWEMVKVVTSIKVVESSTMFRDPQSDQQQSMQLFQLGVNTFDHFGNLASQGIIKEVPNLLKLYKDLLRTFGKQDPEEYLMPFQLPPPPPDETPLKIMGVIYANCPPDVRREIEQALGLQPSQSGQDAYAGQGAGSGDTGDGAEMAQIESQGALAKDQMNNTHASAMQSTKQVFDAHMKAMDHAHQEKLALMKSQHEAQVKNAQMGHEGRMAVMQTQADEAKQSQQLAAQKETSTAQMDTQKQLAKSKAATPKTGAK